MSRYSALLSSLLASALFLGFAARAHSQQSLQALHTRVPAPPSTAAAAPGWLASAEVTALRKQLKDQRAFVDKLSKDAGTQATANASNGPIDFARMPRDPAYAQQMQQKVQSMSQAEQMAFAMEMQKASQASAIENVQAMAADSEAVQLAAEHYPDYQMKQSTGGIQAQFAAVSDIRQKVSARELQIGEQVMKKMKCRDGEGSCTAAEQAADKVALKAAHAQIVAEYDVALKAIAAQVDAARKSRAADIAAVQKDLAPAQYGAAAQSSTNKQLLAAYHNAALIEVEQLFTLSEDSAKWAAARVKDRSVNFLLID